LYLNFRNVGDIETRQKPRRILSDGLWPEVNVSREESLTLVTDRTSPIIHTRPRNLILSQLPVEEYAAIARYLMPVDLPLHKRLSEPNQPIDYIFFANTGLISTDAVTLTGEQVEVGVIGREGFSGLPALFDQPQMSHTVLVQGAGEGLRIRSSILRSEFLKGGVLQKLVHTFAYLQLVQITQSVLCNRLHEVEGRLARWLLTSADRTETESLLLTQEFLSQMLGVQRSTVTVAAGELQRAGIISYSRGHIHILDRPALASRACECYTIVNTSYQRILKRTPTGDFVYAI
jgi:CRP-like cAMP-binding protein